jgi:sulfur-carrier protein adenylyltransferase/sulfurtransferase
MRWKQFFTPVKSFDALEAGKYLKEMPPAGITVLDVRQPNEYQAGHIPGAKLIPLPDLGNRLNEIDSSKPTLVYCAIGGRSRVAAQMLAGKGFADVINLSGGFKAWTHEAAYGDLDDGLELFGGDESIEHVLAVAYSLEVGLEDFYQQMTSKVIQPDAKTLFEKLAGIEEKHQQRVYDIYAGLATAPVSIEVFAGEVVTEATEGGLTTEDYMARFQPDLTSPADIIGLAMSIEAQALDLYLKTAERSEAPESRQALMQIADEERAHLNSLGKVMEKI